MADSDFTAVLAHNYAERWLYPDLDVYPWLVQRYVGLLEAGELVPASGYLCLDVTLEQRVERRKKDWPDRRRNDMFFQGRFPERMRRFYWMLMHPDAWDGLLDVVSDLSAQRHGPCMESLITALRATVDDPPV